MAGACMLDADDGAPLVMLPLDGGPCGPGLPPMLPCATLLAGDGVSPYWRTGAGFADPTWLTTLLGIRPGRTGVGCDGSASG